MTKSSYHFFFFLIICFSIASCNTEESHQVLVFSKTKGWKHSSIPAGMQAIQKLGNENGFEVDTTRDASTFNDSDLRRYDAVVFLNTTGNVLNAEQQAAFERYIQSGGGFVGIHSAAATEYEWPWYNKLVGAYFANHPINPGVRKGVIEVTDTSHLSTRHLPLQWEREEEWYSFRSIYSNIKVLAELDENSYIGGTNGSKHPISWYHEFDGGRSFYTASGHDDKSFTDDIFLRHILGGIRYAIGIGERDYSKAYAKTVPEENRFTKTVLANDLDTPMELAVSDDGRIFFTELRTANLYVYNTIKNSLSLIHRFDVCTEGGAGLIGITLDPDFGNNNFIYLYYSPPTDKEPIVFNLSRFTLLNEKLDLQSEKILLQVPVQKNSGAHHGGSLAWDKDGNLYLPTGDSTTPFPANGYAPIDEREGKEYFSMDAQRGASNTNDLKGKILRIHPEPDGTYSIPQGNLFPKGMEKTRPEIFVMGCRNPYRIAVNPKTSALYWGEIGPDAGKDSVQGPRGYDEFNQAKKAGNYGWPYFVGKNYAYSEWDFETNTAGKHYDPQSPVNNSPNNTGLEKLPPALPAMIWYPYAPSPEFPELGQGGRSAMAGSFNLWSEGSENKNKFPSYYDGGLFVFDWMRNWVMVLRFDENENYLRSEPFMVSNGDFRRPIDLAFSKDGIMYMLEYGSVYGANNDDARLVKIEYNTGNRAPIAKAGIPDPQTLDWNSKVFLTSEQASPVVKQFSGKAPLEVSFTSSGSKDPDDDDEITYEWNFGDGAVSTELHPKHTYEKNGLYRAILKVTDKSGATGYDTLIIKAGNTSAVVSIETPDNKSFFWPNKPFRYAINIKDEDETDIILNNLEIEFDYSASAGKLNFPDNAVREKFAETPKPPAPGLLKIQNSDCKACHTLNQVSVGPSYTQISTRYRNDKQALTKLTKKIIEGGGGNWGTDHVMSAHPQLAREDVEEMVKFILAIKSKNSATSKLSQKGELNLTQHKPEEWQGAYTLIARYKEREINGIPGSTSSEMITLRPAKQRAIDADTYSGIDRFGDWYSPVKHKSFLLFKSIDLTGIRKFSYEYSTEKTEGEIEVRLNSLAGPVISTLKFKPTGGWETKKEIMAPVDSLVSGRHHVYFIMLDKTKPSDDIIKIWTITFEK